MSTTAPSKHAIELLLNPSAKACFSTTDGRKVTAKELVSRMPSVSDPDAFFKRRSFAAGGHYQTLDMALDMLHTRRYPCQKTFVVSPYQASQG